MYLISSGMFRVLMFSFYKIQVVIGSISGHIELIQPNNLDISTIYL